MRTSPILLLTLTIIVVVVGAILLLPQTFLISLALPVAGFVLFLLLWACRWSEQLGDDRINRFHVAMQTASHGLTALGVLTVAVLFIEERQWDPRFSVEVKADAHMIPAAPKKTAAVQLAIAITNEGRVLERVNFIEVAALGLRGAAAQDREELADLKATEFYKVRTSRWIGVGPGETEYQYIEIPVPCDWSLVRFLIKVPEPPVHVRQREQKVPVYERKLLVSLSGVCATSNTQ